MAQNNLENLRHSAAHLLAAAVIKLYPKAKPTIGPVIENGFYYDFDFSESISEEDLPKIEKEMAEIVKSWNDVEKKEISLEEAKKIFADNPYKLELIEELATQGDALRAYKTGEFEDLCKGGHVENPAKEIKAFKLLSIAGAYWRGSEKNKMLTRIYGTCFPTQKELDDYLNMLEEAKKRDHKKLGPQLGIFMFHQTSPGMPYWLPKGTIIINELVKFWREEHEKRGYQEIKSPLMNKKELYVTSGHWEHYKENMFIAKTEEGEEYGVKPMNCPNAMVVYDSNLHSYKDLPLRLSDTDTLHRYERSGTLNGLLRVREFSQDDAHIFVKEDQIKEEYLNIFEIVEKFYSIFNLKYSFRLGTRPEKSMGDIETWNKAEEILKNILKESGKEHFILEGDGAFYGPKIDILMKDALGREWQMGTIQLDFQIPKNFGLEYTDADGKKKMPIVIHRVIYGSLERFVGILIEHFGGAFPTWLSPVQVQIVPITDRNNEYGQNVLEHLKSSNIRAEMDDRGEKMQGKIRDAQLQKIPYMLIIGDREEKENKVAVRTRDGKDLGAISLEEFTKKIRDEIAQRS
ncbi:MAG: threonine--tRNA ligase [Candidatus Daviesbacteria bacterium]|nr:threonine--tRNA ligase [Candidatus Daviesbacteria bacterium]